MVIGSGMMARAFRDFRNDGGTVVFASGVSNSKEVRESLFSREEGLLRRALEGNDNKTFVYFSTCSIYDPDLKESCYTRHKLRMESIIEDSAANYLIFRISNVVGFTDNEFTVVNFLFNKISNGEEFELWRHSYRNIIDIDDVVKIVSYVIDAGGSFANSIMNLAAASNTSTEKVVRIIEEITGKKASCRPVEKGSDYRIDTTIVNAICDRIGIVFNDNYVSNTLRKYYAPGN